MPGAAVEDAESWKAEAGEPDADPSSGSECWHAPDMPAPRLWKLDTRRHRRC